MPSDYMFCTDMLYGWSAASVDWALVAVFAALALIACLRVLRGLWHELR